MRGSPSIPISTSTTSAARSRARSSGSWLSTRPAKPRWTICSAARCSWISTPSSAGPCARECRSYSLKNLEPLFGFTRTGAVQSGTQAILTYERWLHHGSQSLLDEIAAYNQEDCRSTLGLLAWLHRIRPADLPWPAAPEPQPLSPEASEVHDVRQRLREELVTGAEPGSRAGWRVSYWSITGARPALPGGPTSIASASRRKSCWRIRRPSPTSRSIGVRRPRHGRGRRSIP